MKKFRYINTENYYKTLTLGKVYDAIEHISDDTNSCYDRALLINDNGEVENIYCYSHIHGQILREVSVEYRNEVINDILK